MTPQDATGADLTASRASEAARVDRSGERPTEPLAGSGRRFEHGQLFDPTPYAVTSRAPGRSGAPGMGQGDGRGPDIVRSWPSCTAWQQREEGK